MSIGMAMVFVGMYVSSPTSSSISRRLMSFRIGRDGISLLVRRERNQRQQTRLYTKISPSEIKFDDPFLKSEKLVNHV